MAGVNNYRKICITAAFVLLNACIAIAQTDAKIDSLLRQAKLDIYDKPERVIKLGDSLYNSPGASLDTRVSALMIISDAYSSKRDYQKSLKYFHTANELSKDANNVKLQISVLSRTAVRYQQMKMYDKAIECLDESDKLIAASNDKKDFIYTQGNNYVVRGLIYKEQLNCDIAINYLNKGIDVYHKTATTLRYANLSIAYYNRGNCYVLLSDYEAAEKSFNEAIASADKVNTPSLKAFALKGLAEVYANEGNHQKAIETLNEALRISQNVGDVVLNRGLYIGLANNYKAVNNWAEYQKYNALFLKNQSLAQESERQSISDSVKELTGINKEKTNKIKTRYYSIILLEILLFFTFAYLLYAYHRRSKKAVEALNLEIKRIKDTLKKETH